MQQERRYGFFTAIAMIIGVVIGSGIFFKTDNVLQATGGSLGLGILLFCLAATGIVFGALAISELAKRSDRAGGIVAYAEQYYSRKLACSFGWFQTFMYYPSLQAVVSWVAAVYLCMLFPIESTLGNQVLIGIAILILIYILNIFAPKVAGYFQVSTTVIKVVPLVFLAIAGLVVGDGSMAPPMDSMGEPMHNLTFLAAIPPVAFSFDGWIAATSISKELKREKRDLPLALIIAPIFILGLYLLYFIGMTKFVGVGRIIELGDQHVYYAAESVLGNIGAKIVVIFVLISVLGTCNGLVLSNTRMPYALAENKMIFQSQVFSKKSVKMGVPIYSACLSFVFAMVWTLAHYLTTKFGLLGGSDVSEIAVVAQYGMFIFLYYQVFKLWRKREVKGIFKGIIVPLMAVFGAIFNFLGGLANPMFIINLLLVGAVCIAGYLYEKCRNKTSKSIVHITNEDERLPMFDLPPDDSIDIAIDIIEEDENEGKIEHK